MVIDLESGTLMPGLMDMHVHLSSQQSGQAGYAERFFLNPADMALRATTYAKKTLMAGFTTVRDCGAGNKLNLALRDAVAKGWIVGPRIIAAGSVTTTGGHGDSTNGLATELQELLAPVLPGTANGPDEMRAARAAALQGRRRLRSRSPLPAACSAWRRAGRRRSSPTRS